VHSPSSAAGPFALLVVAVGTDAWVYLDARRRAAAGDPVEASLGSIALESPTAWFMGCLVLWVLFFPMYLVARSR